MTRCGAVAGCVCGNDQETNMMSVAEGAAASGFKLQFFPSTSLSDTSPHLARASFLSRSRRLANERSGGFRCGGGFCRRCRPDNAATAGRGSWRLLRASVVSSARRLVAQHSAPTPPSSLQNLLKYKCVFLGDQGTGKTSIIKAFMVRPVFERTRVFFARHRAPHR